jgi:hypothetical protein
VSIVGPSILPFLISSLSSAAIAGAYILFSPTLSDHWFKKDQWTVTFATAAKCMRAIMEHEVNGTFLVYFKK